MFLSVATANLYFLPFEQVLDIIVESGFKNIELDLFWERKQWAMAQHLRDVPVKQAINLIHRSGLKVTSIHDGGGVLNAPNSIAGYINPSLDEYLNNLGYIPECIVFHPPHVEGENDLRWWSKLKSRVAKSLEKYRSLNTAITIENEPTFPGYSVPLTTPQELVSFVEENDFAVTLDTTHYASMDIDIIEAAKIINSNVKTVHLSDHSNNRIHGFLGEGILDFNTFFTALEITNLNAITLECSLSTSTISDQLMSHSQLVNRMREARLRVEKYIGQAISNPLF